MVAGGFRTFVAGETLDENKINDFLMQGVLVFADATARDAAITAPVHGQVAFLKDTNTTVFYDGVAWQSLDTSLEVEFLVVAGGGGGGLGNKSGATNHAGGGGGGGDFFAANFTTVPDAVLPVVVGAGGAGAPRTLWYVGSPGGESRLGVIVGVGGGGGGAARGESAINGGGGGSGPSGPNLNIHPSDGGRSLVDSRGFRGGDGRQSSSENNRNGGGGGGGGGAGGDAVDAAAGVGGVGGVTTILTTANATTAGVGQISGSDLYLSGGGGGGSYATTKAGDGGLGGGGAGGNRTDGTNGTALTGGGGGGAGGGGETASGGSGVVILRVASSQSLSFSAGVTQATGSPFTEGTDSVFVITGAGPTDTVTIG